MEVGTAAPPEFRRYQLADKTGVVNITARLLGESSSFRPGKQRWFEISIYKDSDGWYVIHTRGETRVPNEYTKLRVARTTSAFEVIELLRIENRQEKFIPRDSMLALAQAAQWDDDLMERWIDLRG